MKTLLDVNVLITALRVEMPHHAFTRAWLNALLRDGPAFGVADGILRSFVRIATQRPFNPITPIDVALDFAAQLRSAPTCRVISATDSQWRMFDRLCRAAHLRGRAAQDAYWASFALDLECEFVTFDHGFGRIPRLRWRSPLKRQARTNPQ
jgi:toxin-antitoxin system PIN domain toxin